MQLRSSTIGLATPPLHIPRIQELRRMIEAHNNHSEEHQHRIKDIHERLVTNQISSISLRVLDQPENGPNKNKHTRHVKHTHDSYPRSFRPLGLAFD